MELHTIYGVILKITTIYCRNPPFSHSPFLHTGAPPGFARRSFLALRKKANDLANKYAREYNNAIRTFKAAYTQFLLFPFFTLYSGRGVSVR